MKSRARAFSLAVDGVENLRPPHGPCLPTSAQSGRYLADFDAALDGGGCLSAVTWEHYEAGDWRDALVTAACDPATACG